MTISQLIGLFCGRFSISKKTRINFTSIRTDKAKIRQVFRNFLAVRSSQRVPDPECCASKDGLFIFLPFPTIRVAINMKYAKSLIS